MERCGLRKCGGQPGTHLCDCGCDLRCGSRGDHAVRQLRTRFATSECGHMRSRVAPVAGPGPFTSAGGTIPRLQRGLSPSSNGNCDWLNDRDDDRWVPIELLSGERIDVFTDDAISHVSLSATVPICRRVGSSPTCGWAQCRSPGPPAPPRRPSCGSNAPTTRTTTLSCTWRSGQTRPSRLAIPAADAAALAGLVPRPLPVRE